MLNIVIIGAGAIGGHLAGLLAKAQHNVVVVDNNKEKLDLLSGQIDLATRLGSGTDWRLLDSLSESNPDIILALTDNDEINLVACSIAKHLGYPMSVARVKDNYFMNRARLDFARIFDVDHFIAPELLCAYDMLKYMLTDGSLVIENFAHGAVQLRVIKIPSNWKDGDKNLSEIKLPLDVMVGLIKRGDNSDIKVIFPHGDDRLLPGDEVTFIGEIEAIEGLPQFFGIEREEIQSVVIFGASLVGISLAKMLDKRNIRVRIVDRDYDKCKEIAESFPNITVMHHEATDIEFLKTEKIEQSDRVVFCTNEDEVNILGALLSKEIGCMDILVMLSNPSFESVVASLGISFVASPRFSAANRILSQIFTETVTSLVSLYDNRAEVMEVDVSMESKIVGIPLAELGPLMPKNFLIAMIQNRGRLMVANGSRIISPGDTVIVIADPKHLSEIKKVF